jgi:cell division septum initiation protein DivIVA
MKPLALFLCLTGIIPALANAQDRDQRIADLERQLTEAKGSVAALQKTIESLSAEVQALHQPEPKSVAATTGAKKAAAKRLTQLKISPHGSLVPKMEVMSTTMS